MAEATLSAKRWNSFVCPDCRLIFRVPQDHDGIGIVCPSCALMLRLPAAGEETPPLIAPAPEPLTHDDYEREHDHDEEDHEHHDDEEDHDHAEEEASSFPWKLVIGMTVPGVALLIGFGWWLKTRTPVASNRPLPTLPKLTIKDDEPVPDEIEKELPQQNIKISELEPVAKAFMDAPTMEEALQYVAEPERTRRRWTAWLGDKPFEAPGFTRVTSDMVAVGNRELVAIRVVTKSFETREIAFHLGGGKRLIDWETWVGWSEMGWDDFRQRRVQEGKWFRVILSWADYFNFGFTDETKWSCYRLESPDRQQSFYGYVRRTSTLDTLIRQDNERDRTPLLLKLRFPENPQNDSQVLIEEVKGQGWMEDEEAGN